MNKIHYLKQNPDEMNIVLVRITLKHKITSESGRGRVRSFTDQKGNRGFKVFHLNYYCLKRRISLTGTQSSLCNAKHYYRFATESILNEYRL